MTIASQMMSRPLDPRRTPARPDLAASSLRQTVAAPRYSDGRRAELVWPTAPLRRAPDASLPRESEVIYGESLTVYDDSNGWSWVQLERDGYVGYLPSNAISGDVQNATHRVKALAAFVYPAPDFKTMPVTQLPLNALVTVVRGDDRFAELQRGGFVATRHVCERNKTARDYVEVAERFSGTPYLWGGKTRTGIDCSGLVQTSLHAAGIMSPRDSDMQFAELGAPVRLPPDLDEFERGDLVFWKGHVGIMLDGILLLHANAHHMEVTVETMPEAAARIAKSGHQITGVKRLQALAAPRR